MTHWLLVSSPLNFETSRLRGFDVTGMKNRWAKAASEVRPGDTIFFYVTGEKAIAGEAKANGEAYFDETKIWESTKPGEAYPHRFPIELVKARDKDDYLAVELFLEDYENAKKWPAKNWTLAFQGNVHRLNDHDYQLIHDLL
jgi:predicted RNA-binding protein with PUA-like domain